MKVLQKKFDVIEFFFMKRTHDDRVGLNEIIYFYNMKRSIHFL